MILIKLTTVRWAGMFKAWDRRHACRVLVVKPEVKRPLSRPRRKRECNTKMDFTEIGRGGGEVAGIRFMWHGKDTSGDVLADTVMNPRVQ
jgi:hypothetical protein